MVYLLVAVWIDSVRRPSEPGSPPNNLFVPAPKAFRPHERLVVKTCAEQAGEQPANCAKVEAYRGKGILTERFEVILDRDHRRHYVRLRSRALPQLHQCVALFDTEPDDAPRPMVL